MENNPGLSRTNENPDVTQRKSGFTDSNWLHNSGYDQSINSDRTWYPEITNIEYHLGDLHGIDEIPREENKVNALTYYKYGIGGSVESIFSQTSGQTSEWPMLRPSKSQDALSFTHQGCADNKPNESKCPDIVDDVVGDELILPYQNQNITACRSKHLATHPSPPFTQFHTTLAAERKSNPKFIAENISKDKETQDCESQTVLQPVQRVGQEPNAIEKETSSSSFTRMKEKNFTVLKSASAQPKKIHFIHSSEELDSSNLQAIEPNTSQDIFVSLLKSILTEKEVKINDLDEELKRVETENLQLLEEKDLLLSEIETLRREFEVMTFDKERKKEDVLNLFDPNSPAVLQQQIVNLKNQISDLQEANESVVLELAKADEEISQQKKDMAMLKDEYNQKLEDSQEEIKLLTEKLSHMPSRFIERKNYEEDLHKEISQLRGECRRLRIHNHQLSEQNHHLQEELRDVKRQYECLIKSKTCSSTAEDEVETERLKNESFTKYFYSSNWNPEEDSLYRNDAFKVDGTFSKCKTAVGSFNIKGSWETLV
ncbi:repetitive organellar protein-like [Pelobates fuscus]|uniref:repetitive organellar protein-like n=1 Tax=Pelobates fuscus TaxID=191477 RepID=UPI002FE4CD79